MTDNTNRMSYALGGALAGGTAGAGMAYYSYNPYKGGKSNPRLNLETMRNWNEHLEKNVYPNNPEASKIVNRYSDLQKKLKEIDTEEKLDKFVSENLSKEEQQSFQKCMNYTKSQDSKINKDLSYKKSIIESNMDIDKYYEIKNKKIPGIITSEEVLQRLNYEPEKLTQEMKQVIDKTKNSMIKKYALVYGSLGAFIGAITAYVLAPKKKS